MCAQRCECMRMSLHPFMAMTSMSMSADAHVLKFAWWLGRCCVCTFLLGLMLAVPTMSKSLACLLRCEQLGWGPQTVPSDSKGTVLAVDHALMGLATMVTPIIGAWLFEQAGFPPMAATSALLMLIMMGLVHMKVLHVPEQLC